MKLTPFYASALCFLIGVFFADFTRTYTLFFVTLLLFPCIYWITKSLKYSITSTIGFVCGISFLFFSIPNISHLLLVQATYSNNTQPFSGYITTFPTIKNNTLQFQCQIGNETTLVIKSLQYNNNKNLHNLQYGDFVTLIGKIEQPHNSSQSDFDYKRFLAKDSLFTIIRNPQIIIQHHHKRNTLQTFWRKIFSYRISFEESIRKKLPYPENEYALGITLGNETGIPKDIIEDFNTTGLRHLLALSGMNITILIVFLSSFLFFLPKTIRIITIAFSIIVFVILTGSSSSVVRAGVMGVIGIIALHSGRKMHPLNLLILALTGITLWNPFLLYSDTSLQFSVLAVLGLLYIEPLFHTQTKTKNTSYIPDTLKTILTATLSAQIAVLPLMILFFKQVSLIAPITNILIIPISTLSMIFSFGTALPIIGSISMIFAYGLLHTTIQIAHFFAHVPYATLQTHNIFSFLPFSTTHPHITHTLFIILYYSSLLIILFFYTKKKAQHSKN